MGQSSSAVVVTVQPDLDVVDIKGEEPGPAGVVALRIAGLTLLFDPADQGRVVLASCSLSDEPALELAGELLGGAVAAAARSGSNDDRQVDLDPASAGRRDALWRFACLDDLRTVAAGDPSWWALDAVLLAALAGSTDIAEADIDGALEIVERLPGPVLDALHEGDAMAQHLLVELSRCAAVLERLGHDLPEALATSRIELGTEQVDRLLDGLLAGVELSAGTRAALAQMGAPHEREHALAGQHLNGAEAPERVLLRRGTPDTFELPSGAVIEATFRFDELKQRVEVAAELGDAPVPELWARVVGVASPSKPAPLRTMPSEAHRLAPTDRDGQLEAVIELSGAFVPAQVEIVTNPNAHPAYDSERSRRRVIQEARRALDAERHAGLAELDRKQDEARRLLRTASASWIAAAQGLEALGDNAGSELARRRSSRWDNSGEVGESTSVPFLAELAKRVLSPIFEEILSEGVALTGSDDGEAVRLTRLAADGFKSLGLTASAARAWEAHAAVLASEGQAEAATLTFRYAHDQFLIAGQAGSAQRCIDRVGLET